MLQLNYQIGRSWKGNPTPNPHAQALNSLYQTDWGSQADRNINKLFPS